MIEIKNKTLCMGCHACAQKCPVSCIEMNQDTEGFVYPKVNKEACINCDACEKVCPIKNQITAEDSTKAYAAYNKNDDIRMLSSSGGIFYLVATKVIEHGGIVFGAKYDSDFNIIHSYAENLQDLAPLLGSKYVQSNINNMFLEAKKHLDTDREVLFCGAPCQINGLLKFLGKTYENLITIDFICHGVPSSSSWQKYLNYHESIAHSKVKNISFRNKEHGWIGYNIVFEFENGTKYCSTPMKDSYMRLFLKNYNMRPACFSCKFKGVNRPSDLTLGDFWGISNVAPEMHDDKGTSLIFVHSKKGSELFDALNSDIKSKEVDIQTSISVNPSAIKSSVMPNDHKEYLKDSEILDFDSLAKKYCKESGITKLKSTAKRIIKKISKIFSK